MFKIKPRIYSIYAHKAASLLGLMILLHRKERKMTAQDLADRAGISRTTLYKIEKGDLKCEIGIVFEVAALVGVTLFEKDSDTTDSLRDRINDKIALLPKSVRLTKKAVDDQF